MQKMGTQISPWCEEPQTKRSEETLPTRSPS